MREGRFIKQNIERWESYQQPTEDPDEVAKRFTYLVEDLSYAKTFYPFSKTVRFINALAANIYLSIYQNKKAKRNRVLTFWKTELPLTIRKNHKILLGTFILFIAFVLLGIFSAAHDQTFIRSVLGDGYVEMTESNIARGDPFGVYKNGNELSMFLRIAFNNIKVSFLCFFMGLLFSVGTLYMLFQNSVMLGVFEYMFFHHSTALGIQSLMVVFIHGTLELSALVVASCAGFVLGNSLLFPKTYTRLQSLMMAAKDGIKMIIGLVPVFTIAAFFEGFVTRHTEMPAALSIIILTCSLSFVIWYFIIYPIRVSRKTKMNAHQG